jgi:hypothetical protein
MKDITQETKAWVTRTPQLLPDMFLTTITWHVPYNYYHRLFFTMDSIVLKTTTIRQFNTLYYVFKQKDQKHFTSNQMDHSWTIWLWSMFPTTITWHVPYNYYLTCSLQLLPDIFPQLLPDMFPTTITWHVLYNYYLTCSLQLLPDMFPQLLPDMFPTTITWHVPYNYYLTCYLQLLPDMFPTIREYVR